MALTKDSTGYYLEPSSGQYYEPMPITRSYGGKGMGGGPIANAYWGGMSNLLSAATGREPVADSIVQNGMAYKPFTGNAPGISAGIRSMADQLTKSLANYQAPTVPTIAELFSGMTQPMPMQQAPVLGNVYQAPVASLPAPSSIFAYNSKGKPLAANKQPSMVDELLSRAQNAQTNVAPPSAAQLFPSMSFGGMGDSSGAGRFIS